MPSPNIESLGRAIIFLGPPGAGKGTQARQIATRFDVPEVSTGDMIREHVQRDTPLGRRAKPFMDEGELVPDDVVLNMVEDLVEQAGFPTVFVLDGFPRTLRQAERFDEFLHEHGRAEPLVVHFVVDTNQLLRRLTGRRTCEVGGEIYNIYDNPPKVAGQCDLDGGKLVQRPDDTEEVIARRLDTYNARTRPLVDHYRKEGALVELDGLAPPAVVTERLLEILAPVR
jgi:adenylate kinase